MPRLEAVLIALQKAKGSMADVGDAKRRASLKKVLAACEKQIREAVRAEKKSAKSKAAKPVKPVNPVRRPKKPDAAAANPEPDEEEEEDEWEVVEEEEEEEQEERTPIPDGSTWRLFVLKREPGDQGESTVSAVQVFERVDDDADPEDPDLRVWFLDIFDGGAWAMLDGAREANRLRVHFRADEYYGLPPFLDIEKPVRPRLGSPWRLIRPDGATIGRFSLVADSTVDENALREKEAELDALR